MHTKTTHMRWKYQVSAAGGYWIKKWPQKQMTQRLANIQWVILPFVTKQEITLITSWTAKIMGTSHYNKLPLLSLLFFPRREVVLSVHLMQCTVLLRVVCSVPSSPSCNTFHSFHCTSVHILLLPSYFPPSPKNWFIVQLRVFSPITPYKPFYCLSTWPLAYILYSIFAPFSK